MFVEHYHNRHRFRIGAMDMTQQTRLAANGLPTAFASQADHIANANTLPTLPAGSGLLGSTRINTPSGPVAIEDLNAGATVVSSTGQHVRLSHVLPVARPQKTLRIRAPYFGANQDVIIADGHFIEIHSDVAEYMFGAPSVFVPAWVFKDNSKVLHHEIGKSDMMYQLQLDGCDGIGIGECRVAAFQASTKGTEKRFLNDSEARAFACERRIGQYN